MTTRNSIKDISLLFFIYAISSVFLLLNFDGVYWDGWVAYNQTLQSQEIFFGEFNNFIFHQFYLFMHDIGNGLFIYRFFVFTAYFLTAIVIYLILNTIKELSKTDVFYITLLYIIMPVVSARISVSIIPFFFPLLIFFLSFLLLSKYLKNDFHVLRPVILVGFFFSFYTNSILVFYAVALLYIFYVKFDFTFNKENIKKFSVRYFDFIILPIVFFVVKSIYFKSTGLYATYNVLGEHSVFKKALKLIKSLDTALIDVLSQSLSFSLNFWFIVVIVSFIVIKKLGTDNKPYIVNRNSKFLLLFGLILFLLAIFPYIAVSKLPKVDGMSSRYQLLTPLGLAFIFYFGIELIVKYFKFTKVVKIILLSILVFSFTAKNIHSYYKFQIDTFYMTSIMMNFKDNSMIQDNSTFIVNNNLSGELAYKRKPPFYEWTGMLKKAFGDDRRLMVYYKQYKELDEIVKVKEYEHYNFASWKEENPVLVTISYNYKNRIRTSTFVKLLKLKFKDYDEYLEEVKKLTVIMTERFVEEN